MILFIGVALMAGGLAGSLVSPLQRVSCIASPADGTDGVDPQIHHPGLHRVPVLWRSERRYERRDHAGVSLSPLPRLRRMFYADISSGP